MILTECKNYIANQLGYGDWNELKENQYDFTDAAFDLIVTNVASMYAQEKVKEALRLAAERAEVTISNGNTPHMVSSKARVSLWNNTILPNLDKILSLETELLNKIEKE